MPDSPATTLIAAAKILRGRATADYVTPGPWTVHEANGFLRVDQPGAPGKAWTVKSGADLAEENRGTAEYIALMHPNVGLALVYWLESAARDAEQIGADPFALTVAGQILGVES